MSATTETRHQVPTAILSPVEKALVNRLQHGLPLVPKPYAAVAGELGLSEQQVLESIKKLLAEGVLTRFGPMFHAGKLGGAFTLAAMRIPDEDFERVAEQVNSFDEVAHNYRREHDLNMWFVLATETPEAIESTIRAIEETTGHPVYNMPKEQEFHVHLHFPV
ncbi:Lrp/AsnC family transcriptional regulator [Marinobacter sp. F3R11]|uniref:Lrp/AsnC family transcriptional regulator n=1 Tax=Marinobacter sp. F3R11 TaxID=2267231 RepID=UPI000DE85BE0|nr:Lrp/AsnC family transcriptional regulator [Marinobacter sp. F3R11]RBW48726.1 Lrp/AsnC family transcriptional regulator [Marinobacter sp. F3R11]